MCVGRPSPPAHSWYNIFYTGGWVDAAEVALERERNAVFFIIALEVAHFFVTQLNFLRVPQKK